MKHNILLIYVSILILGKFADLQRNTDSPEKLLSLKKNERETRKAKKSKVQNTLRRNLFNKYNCPESGISPECEPVNFTTATCGKIKLGKAKEKEKFSEQFMNMDHKDDTSNKRTEQRFNWLDPHRNQKTLKSKEWPEIWNWSWTWKWTRSQSPLMLNTKQTNLDDFAQNLLKRSILPRDTKAKCPRSVPDTNKIKEIIPIIIESILNAEERGNKTIELLSKETLFVNDSSNAEKILSLPSKNMGNFDGELLPRVSWTPPKNSTPAVEPEDNSADKWNWEWVWRW